MPGLVASVIVRNEMDRYLPLAVDHLQRFCDEIRVLDDRSEDGTYEFLEIQEKVAVRRNEGSLFFEYESKARQALLEWTMEGRPEYVLSIDADEFIGDPEHLKRQLERKVPVFTLQMNEVWGADMQGLLIRTDGHWGPNRCPILWQAPSRLDDTKWLIPDRKLACGREPLAVRRGGFEPTSISIFHFGWTRRSQREERAERYFTHDKGQFHQDAHLQSILWPDERVKTMRVAWPKSLLEIRGALLERINR